MLASLKTQHISHRTGRTLPLCLMVIGIGWLRTSGHAPHGRNARPSVRAAPPNTYRIMIPLGLQYSKNALTITQCRCLSASRHHRNKSSSSGLKVLGFRSTRFPVGAGSAFFGELLTMRRSNSSFVFTPSWTNSTASGELYCSTRLGPSKGLPPLCQYARSAAARARRALRVSRVHA